MTLDGSLARPVWVATSSVAHANAHRRETRGVRVGRCASSKHVPRGPSGWQWANKASQNACGWTTPEGAVRELFVELGLWPASARCAVRLHVHHLRAPVAAHHRVREPAGGGVTACAAMGLRPRCDALHVVLETTVRRKRQRSADDKLAPSRGRCASHPIASAPWRAWMDFFRFSSNILIHTSLHTTEPKK